MSPTDPWVEAADGWPAREPPPDFADRVLGAVEPHRRRAPWLALAAALVLGIGAALWATRPRPSAGAREVHARTTITLGHRGTAVAEAGAALTWRVENHAARVEQSTGRVFYRVDGAAPFTVITPAGDVEVAGTCFTVEVEPMKSALKGAALGALATALVFVTVYEGQLTAANAQGRVEVAAGERAQLTRERAPRLVRPAEDRAEGAPDQPATRATARSRAEPLEERYEALRIKSDAQARRIAELKAALADQRARHHEVVGEPIPWPDDVPAIYQGEELRRRFDAALLEVGFDGEVTDVDCSEYPCIVYGQLRDDDGTRMDALEAAEALAPYRKAHNSTSAWGGKTRDKFGQERDQAKFGIALIPEADKERSAEIQKRLRLRHSAYVDASRAARDGE